MVPVGDQRGSSFSGRQRRVQLVFLTMLARNAGFRVDDRKLQPEPFLAAMVRSFNGDLAPLAGQIEAML
ncbi:MAG: hypothetical protein Kow0026_23770 [Oricola sp.]